MATSCQKETRLHLETTEIGTVYTVRYATDGVPHLATLYSEEEYDALLMQLMELARNGSVVELSEGSFSSPSMYTKESVSYSSSNNSDAAAWSKQKMKEGYRVRVTYDSSTNAYSCTAYK